MRRVELRELRASLIAQGKEIPPELFGTPHQESNSERYAHSFFFIYTNGNMVNSIFTIAIYF